MVSNALGSAAAGIVSRLCTHPLDTAKARLQGSTASATSTSSSAAGNNNKNNNSYYRGPVDALRRTFRSEGLRGLYRGFGAVIVGGTPGTVLYLCTYEVAKERLLRLSSSRGDSDNNGDNGGGVRNGDFAVHFASGMIAETVSCVVYVPVDVIKERMQVQQRLGSASASAVYYKNGWDALRQISQTEGVRGVYRGYGATLASFGPFSALYFVFYEQFKLMARRRQLEADGIKALGESSSPYTRSIDAVELPFLWTLACSAGAGALASWLTSPLDLAKLRLQVSRGRAAAAGASASGGAGDVAYRGVVDCLQRAYRDGGVRGLFRGAGARVLHFAPATTITMTCYETCRSFVAKLLPDGDDGV